MKRQLTIVRLAILAGLVCQTAAQAQQAPATPRSEVRFDAATERAFDRTGKFLTVTEKPDGTVLTQLNGSFQNVTVARLGTDGKVETFCTTDQEAAARFMAGETVNTADTAMLESAVVEQP